MEQTTIPLILNCELCCLGIKNGLFILIKLKFTGAAQREAQADHVHGQGERLELHQFVPSVELYVHFAALYDAPVLSF